MEIGDHKREIVVEPLQMPQPLEQPEPMAVPEPVSVPVAIPVRQRERREEIPA